MRFLREAILVAQPHLQNMALRRVRCKRRPKFVVVRSHHHYVPQQTESAKFRLDAECRTYTKEGRASIIERQG
jgi:hypothetical protein